MNGLLAIADCALQILPHRGSSVEETYLFDNKQIVNRNNVWIIFEGRLFNRKRIIEKICNRNQEADCQSDTDIALELFLQDEIHAFAQLEGYWSFIIADKNKQKIYAARDHFGNCPLYYCQIDRQFGIASESKTLFSIFKDTGKINENAVLDFLQGENINRHKQNFFSNIHEIKPSCYLVYSLIDNTFEEKSYYILPYKNCKGGFNKYEEPFHIDKVRQLILENISKNIEGRDKISIGFNGGVESAALLCCAKKLNPDCQITAFTSNDLYNEREISFAKKTIKHTGVDWINVSCTSQQIVQQLLEINKKQNFPVFSPNYVIQYNVIATAKQYGFDAIMDWQGADELFAGHTYYFLPFLKSLRSQWMFKDWTQELLHIHNAGISCKKLLSLKWKRLKA